MARHGRHGLVGDAGLRRGAGDPRPRRPRRCTSTSRTSSAKASRTRRVGGARGSSTSRPACVRSERWATTGAYSVEHEPEDRDPSEEIASMRRQLEGWLRMRIALVGAGNIADRYAAAIAAAPELELVGATDLERSRAEALAGEFGGRAYPDLDAMLADDAGRHGRQPDRPAGALRGRRRRARGRQARPQREAARRCATRTQSRSSSSRRERGVRLSSAPTTLLGEAQQTRGSASAKERSAACARSTRRRTGAGSRAGIPTRAASTRSGRSSTSASTP